MPDGAGEGSQSEPLNRSKPRGYDVVNKEKRSRGREQQTGGIKARQPFCVALPRLFCYHAEKKQDYVYRSDKFEKRGRRLDIVKRA